MTEVDPALSPGDAWTFQWPRRVGRPGTGRYECELHMAPLAVHDAVERFNALQRLGRTPKRVFIRRGLWDQLRRQGNLYAQTRWGPRQDWLLGVEVKFTAGKLPFYVVDDKGNKL